MIRRCFRLVLVLLLVPALAHAASCTRPDKPHFPDPKTAAPDVVAKLDTAMQRYSTAVTAYVECLSREAEAAQAEGSKMITVYNDSFLPEYNKRATAQ